MILGVTGNIASGKSTVTRELARRGAVVIDADQLAREVVEPGSKTLQELVATFGREILGEDGRLDRNRLGRIVFADDAARERLNRIVHPAIAELSVQRLAELRDRNDVPLIVYEAPLLFEAGAQTRVDKVLVVTIDPEEQLKRLMARDGWDPVAARQRIRAQMDQQEKIRRADYVLDNSGRPEAIVERIDELWPEWTADREPER